MYVIKASGEKEQFDPKKIFKTCLRAGASKDLAGKVAEEVGKKVYDGITTKEILNLALSLLKEKPEVVARYDLKRAIMMLGPTGFPFEKFFAEVLQNYGYKTEIGKIIRGKQVNQEVDITAVKESAYMVECKYHNAQGIHTGLKVAMYTYARFLDLKEHFDHAWLVCNTKCSGDAIKYSEGVNQRITSWRYPKKESLEQLIEQKNLYPITILKSINKNTKDKLAQANIMLAKDLLDYNMNDLKRKTGLSENILKKVILEVKDVCFC